MRALVREAGLEGRVELDSAGTGGWHVGDPPDARAAATARRRGIDLEGAARQVRREDFEAFDLILAMDRENLRELRRLARDERAAGEGEAAARVRPRAPARRSRGARPLLRAAGRLRRGARPRASRLRAACSGQLRSDASTREPARRERVTSGGWAAATSTRPGASRSPMARDAFVKTRPDAAPGEYAAEAAGLRWLAEPGGAADPAGAGGRRGPPRARVGRSPAASARRARRSSAAASRSSTPPGPPASATPAVAARFGSLALPNDPAPDWPTFYVAAAPASRWLASARERRAISPAAARAVERCVRAPAGARRPDRAPGAAARGPVARQRHGRRRGPPVADRPLRLRRPPRGRPRDAARCSGRPPSASSPPTRRRTRSPRAGRSASSCGSCCRCWCTRCCSAAPTAPPPSGSHAAIRRRSRFAGAGRSRGCAGEHPQRAAAAVPAGAGRRRAPLPPAADARGGGARAGELAAPAAARVRPVRGAPSRRTSPRGGWRRRWSC